MMQDIELEEKEDGSFGRPALKHLQWSTISLETGLGGVEVHARSLQRELRSFGVESEFSEPNENLERRFLTEAWDVVHTHGSAVPLRWFFLSRKLEPRPILVHTLHGTTLGRMAACKEWFWLGGYAAALREFIGVLAADVVVSVNPSLWLYRFAQKLGKTCVTSYNGWDTAGEIHRFEEPNARVREVLSSCPDRSFWLFVGRGQDPVKGAPFLLQVAQKVEGYKWVAVPGSGFESDGEIATTGRLEPSQVRALMARARGLVLPSSYESFPIVVLEALSLGLPVVATKVGGVEQMAEKAQGLTVVAKRQVSIFSQALDQVERELLQNDSSENRKKRATHNQKVLPTWKGVAESVLRGVFQHAGKDPQSLGRGSELFSQINSSSGQESQSDFFTRTFGKRTID